MPKNRPGPNTLGSFRPLLTHHNKDVELMTEIKVGPDADGSKPRFQQTPKPRPDPNA